MTHLRTQWRCPWIDHLEDPTAAPASLSAWRRCVGCFPQSPLREASGRGPLRSPRSSQHVAPIRTTRSTQGIQHGTAWLRRRDELPDSLVRPVVLVTALVPPLSQGSFSRYREPRQVPPFIPVPAGVP